MRSQDVLHSAYMPHFRAQMNCVPGMVTSFSFIPSVTTAEMRDKPAMIEKVANINAIRAKKSIDLVANGQVALDPYTFDFLLLCNKICGTSHYNMQMKIVVDTPEEYKAWLKDRKTIVQAVKNAADEAKASEVAASQTKDSITAKSNDTTVVAQAEMK
jgi:cytochrome c oxidase subunit 2